MEELVEFLAKLRDELLSHLGAEGASNQEFVERFMKTDEISFQDSMGLIERIANSNDPKRLGVLLKLRAEAFLSSVSSEIPWHVVLVAYPTDKPYPSCLIFGKTFGGDPVHSVWAYNEQNRWAVLVTVYRPDPTRWINWRERKRS